MGSERKGCELDTVLGLSMTPTAVGLVLVEGFGADGEIMDQDAIDIPTRRGATAISTSEYVAGAMSRTRAMANGRQPHTIGVTWSDNSQLEASLVLSSLTDAGFDNVVAVRSPEAGEALARGIGRAVGYQQTAVCVIEPGSVFVSLVDTDDHVVDTVTFDENTKRSLIGWLSSVFDANEWRPECLILVGPDADLTGLAKRLEHNLRIPVFAPPEAELALARGAALASAQNPVSAYGDYGESQGRRSWPLPYAAALTMLVVGVLAFVVSVSLVAGMKLTGNTKPGATSAGESAAKPTTPPAVAQVAPPAAPPHVAPAPPPEAVPALQPEPAAVPTAAQPASPAQEVSAAEPEQPPEAAPPPEAAQPPDVAPAPAAPPASASAPDAKPPMLTRILSHIPGLHGGAPPPANQPAPDAAVPPDAPPPPP